MTATADRAPEQATSERTPRTGRRRPRRTPTPVVEALTVVEVPVAPTHIDVTSPATGETVGRVAIADDDAVAAVIDGLRAAQPAWAALGVRERVRWMGRFRDWLITHQRDIDDVLVAETGKPRAEVGLEIASSLGVMRYYSQHAATFLADDTPGPSSLLTALKRLRVRHVPQEVVGVISPWNFPVAMGLWDAVPALLAGCSVVLKPSEHTPLATDLVVRGWREIGAPPVLGVVHGAGTTGAAVVDRVDHVHFTGSTRTGRRIAERAASRLVPCSLELGGNDPAIVLADADLDLAAAGIVSTGLLNAGQMCVAVERVYVVAEVHDRFVDKVLDRVLGLRSYGDGYSRDIGSMITAEQHALVTAHVEDAVARGAKAAVGGRTGPNQQFRPTVLVDVDHSMRVMREETFGPVLPIMKVADVDEAVRLANDSEYGLSASVWSRDRRAAEKVAERLEVGTVDINDAATHILCHPAPQAGWKQSGMGARLGGAAGIRKFTRPQVITHNTVDLPVVTALAGFPYSRTKSGLLAGIGRFTDGGALAQRLGLPPVGEFRVRVATTIDADPAAVHAWLLDSSTFSRLPGVGVRRLRRGPDGADAVGTVREVRLPLGTITEEITEVSSHAIGYRVLSTPLPVEHLGARIVVHPQASGCYVEWTSRFHGGPLQRVALEAALTPVFYSLLRRCAQELGQAH